MTRLSVTQARKLGILPPEEPGPKRRRKGKDDGPPLSEKEIQAAIKQYLQLKGWYVIRHQQGLGCHKGLSDLTAIKDGKTIYIEVKKPGGTQSWAQIEFERQIKDHGGTYFVATSVEDVQREVE